MDGQGEADDSAVITGKYLNNRGGETLNLLEVQLSLLLWELEIPSHPYQVSLRTT